MVADGVGDFGVADERNGLTSRKSVFANNFLKWLDVQLVGLRGHREVRNRCIPNKV